MRGILKGVMWVGRGCSPLTTHAILGFGGPVHAIWWVDEKIFLGIKPDIVSVAGANMQWSCFVSPSCSEKRENTAFELVL